MAVIFAIFQTIMPALGYMVGYGLRIYISHIDHWIAFALLLGIGIRFIQEANTPNKTIHTKNWKVLCLLGIATSIDALVVGVTFAFMDVSILLAITIIGIATFIISFLGYEFGRRLCNFNSKKIEIIGGIILITIGVKILITHLFF